jgi:hypothetical protein
MSTCADLGQRAQTVPIRGSCFEPASDRARARSVLVRKPPYPFPQVHSGNKSSIIFNLLRDDLGRSGDPVSMNYEIAYGRGIWAQFRIDMTT